MSRAPPMTVDLFPLIHLVLWELSRTEEIISGLKLPCPSVYLDIEIFNTERRRAYRFHVLVGPFNSELWPLNWSFNVYIMCLNFDIIGYNFTI